MIRRAILASIVAPAIASAQPLPTPANPAPPPDDEVTHYYTWTLTADAIGFAALVAGGIAEHDGRDTDLSGALFAAGTLGITLATPIIHASRGHTDRALGSLLLRGSFGSFGSFVGLTASAGCKGLFCELEYLGIGFAGGVAVASLADAMFLTTERRPRARPTWAPQVTTTRDGMRVGFATTF